MKKVFLLSQDNYLNIAISSFFIGSQDISFKKIEDSYLDELKSDVCVLLVDSRVPYMEVEKKISSLSSMGVGVNVLVLKMNSCFFFSLGYCNYSIVDMMGALNFCMNNILLHTNKKKFNATKFLELKHMITDHDLDIIYMFETGMDMSVIACIEGVSVKRIYFYREQLYKKLDFKNYHQACIFVFQNKLLDYYEA
ncbi:helix-turn-helix transcriptional regulator [Enterobacter ludwigii]|uniref:helix-turn-helix transcriptional regulator n=1 Tax=Enterobacter ludwigii TaxID=299767 RepID=UPI003FD5D920